MFPIRSFKRAKSLLAKRYDSLLSILLVASIILVNFSPLGWLITNVEAAPIAAVANGAPAEVFLGEDFSFDLTFSNSGTVGYGPFIDMIIEYTGVDGVHPFTAGIEADGLDFVSANYLGASIVTSEYDFPDDGGGTGCVDHPYAVDSSNTPISVCGTAGDKLIVFQLPFGSFVSGQPDAPVSVTLNMSSDADLGVGLDILTRGGFEFGEDPLRNPSTDPSIYEGFVTDSVSPSVVIIDKSENTPENETATGPNFPRDYTVTAEKAAGQEIGNFVLGDNLPPEIVVGTVNSSTPGGAVETTTPTNIELEWDPWLAASTDANYSFDFYVPDVYGGSSDVLTPSSGGCNTIENDIYASGDWVPSDSRDTNPTSFVSDATAVDDTFSACALVMQKSVSLQDDQGPTGVTPGDTLEYTMNFQISDYFAFEGLYIEDTFSDGQRFDASFTPTLSVTEHGATSSGDFDGANFSYLLDSPGTGTTTANFNISDELVTRAVDAQVLGGCVPALGGSADCGVQNLGATTGTVVFRTVVQQAFSDDYPSGEPNVDQGDQLTNSATIYGDVLVNATLTDSGNDNSNGSSASATIVDGTLAEKAIYAINGSTSFSLPPAVSPGTTVTYALRFEMPSSDVDELVITDYLPLPVFDATEITTFDPTVDASIPAAGTAKFGVNDTFYGISGIVPTLATDSGDNTIEFDYGSNQEDPEFATTIEIYFTVTLTDEPFGDGLYLTNQALGFQDTTNTTATTSTQIVQVLVQLPNLQITKGIVSTSSDAPDAVFSPTTVGPVTFDAPGSSPSFTGTINSTNLGTSPIDSDLGIVDAGDLVTYAIVIENTGESPQGAFDVQIRDDLPAGLEVPSGGLNLQVRDGTGAAVTFSAIDGGDTYPILEDGIELTDSAVGSIDTYDPSDGENIIVITFDLEVADSTSPNLDIVNTATLFNFASAEGGTDYTGDDLVDTATVTTTNTTATKSIVETSESHTGFVSGTERVVVGEIIRYRLEAHWPEGTSTDVYFDDNIPTRLQFINDDTATIAFVSNDTGLTSSTVDQLSCSSGTLAVTGDESTIASITPDCLLADAFISDNSTTNSDSYGNGTDVFFLLGDITNADNDADYEYIVIEFNAVMLNDSGNQSNNRRRNDFDIYDSTGLLDESNQADTRLAEPSIDVSKTVTSAPEGGGDGIVWEITITNDSTGNNAARAFELNLTDTIQSDINTVGISHTSTPGYLSITDNSSGNNIDIDYNYLDPGDSITLEISGTTDINIASGLDIDNTATVTFSSLPGDYGTTSNPTGTDPSSLLVGELTPVPAPGGTTGERNGDDGVGGALNDYAAEDTVTTTISLPVIDKITETPTPEATIGDTGLTFDVLVTLTEGDTSDFVLTDHFPDGLAYQTATVITTAAASGGLLTDDFNGSVLSPTIPGASTSGVDIDIDFGDITVADDDDPDTNSFVVRFTATVVNDISAQNGGSLTNTASASYTDPNTTNTVAIPDTDSTGSDVDIVEPILDVDKSITSAPSPADAGGTVEYTIIVDHNSSSASDAFDVVIGDVVPADLESVTVTSATHSVSGALGSDVSGNTITVPDSGTIDILEGESVTIVFTADITSAAGPDQDITNTASATWSSQDGTISDERVSGSGLYDDGETGANGLNDYEREDSATFTTDSIGVDKSTASDTTTYIGQSIYYDITIDLPEGVTEDFVITDEVPSGMQYVSYQVITTAAGTPLSADFNGTITSTPTVTGGASNGEDVDFDFGDVTLVVDNDNTNNSMILRVTLQVLNVAANQDGVDLDNYGAIAYTDPNDGVSTLTGRDNVASTVTVIEPVLEITKTATSFPANVESGTTVTYQLDIAHNASSTADAYEVVINDPGTAELINLSSVSVVVGGTASISAPTHSIAGDVLRVPASGSFTLPNDGTTLTITFDAEVSAGASVTIDNTANIEWASDVSTNTEARDSSGTGPYDDANGGAGGLNDYINNDNDDQVSTDSPTFVKSIATTNGAHTSESSTPRELAIGEEVTFFLRAGMPEGDTAALEVIDTFPTNLSFDSYSLVTLAANSYGEFGTDFSGTIDPPGAPTIGGGTITFNVTNVSVPVNGDGTDNFFGIEVVAHVTDTGGNTDGTTFDNSATTEANSSGDVVDGGTVSMEIVEPDVEITKNIVETEAAPNDTITVEINIANNGNTTAFDIEWQDDLDDLSSGIFEYVASSASLICDAGAVGETLDDSAPPATQIITGTIDELPAGDECDISFDVVITNGTDAFLQSSANEQNQAEITAVDTMPGDVTDERDYSDSDTDGIRIVKADLAITKDDGIALIAPGGSTTYTLTVTNNGEHEATGIVITETVPDDTVFDAGSSTAGWVCTPDSNAGSTCTFDFDTFHGGALASTASNSVDFAIIVDDPIPGVTTIDNTASVTDDGATGPDPTPADNTDTDSNSTAVLVDHYVTIDDGDITSSFNSVIVYTVDYGNLGTADGLNTTISIVVPADTSFDAGSSSGGWVCTPDASAGSTCTNNIGTLAGGGTGSLNFAVLTNDYLPVYTQIDVQADIADDGSNGADVNLVNNTDTDDTPILYSNVFDPPSSIKTVDASGYPTIEWQMVWINDGNITALLVRVVDPIPTDASYVPGSVVCDARGLSTTTTCIYDAVEDEIVWEGDIAPDPGGTDEDDSLNEVVITFSTTVPLSVLDGQNQATAYWDDNDDGDIDDDILAGQTPVMTDDPSTSPSLDPTAWEVLPAAGGEHAASLSASSSILVSLFLILNLEKLPVWIRNLAERMRRRFKYRQ